MDPSYPTKKRKNMMRMNAVAQTYLRPFQFLERLSGKMIKSENMGAQNHVSSSVIYMGRVFTGKKN